MRLVLSVTASEGYPTEKKLKDPNVYKHDKQQVRDTIGHQQLMLDKKHSLPRTKRVLCISVNRKIAFLLEAFKVQRLRNLQKEYDLCKTLQLVVHFASDMLNLALQSLTLMCH